MEDKNPLNKNTNIDTSDSNAIRRAKEVRDRAAREAREMDKKASEESSRTAKDIAKVAQDAADMAAAKAEESKEARKAEEQARKEAERAAKEKAKQEAIEAREKAEREAEKAKEARKAEEQARKEAERAAKEKAKQEAEEARDVEHETFEIEITDKGTQSIKPKNIDKTAVRVGHEMFEGMVKLQIAPPVDSGHMKELENKLRQTKGLKLMLIGGIADGGMQIVVSIKKRSPLLKILLDIPQVEEASGKGDEVYISLK